MTGQPAITVVMPVRNAEATLAAAVDSILSQTRDDFELLAIDDGSSDGSRQILEHAASRDPRVRVLAQTHQGITKSLIRGVSEARGVYVARQDADDLSEPQRFDKQTGWLESHELGAVGTAALIIDTHGEPTGQFPVRFGAAAVREGLMAVATAPVHGSLMFRRDCLDAVGGYRAAFVTTQDYDLCLRLSERFTLDNMPDVLYRWRLDSRTTYARKRRLQMLYGGVARVFADERQRTGVDSYALFEQSGGDFNTFASQYQFGGRLHALWGELLLRGLNDPKEAFTHLSLSLRRGYIAPKPMALLAWTAFGLPWPGGKPL